MASLIEGYNYDVFISYRQKDNKYDGWVTAFVENLRLELEATFKEDISVYFDMNPYDGLLESNEVDGSLKDKLKCVIFIPVLSQTYCDPKSFAFENEFKKFVTQSSRDNIGLKVNLTSGNVSSRVLPVRINELNKEDLSLVESIIGGPLRGIDFIYRSPGVNRPLRQIEDHPQDNLNKTFYRDQINKAAQSIKNIIISIKGDYTLEEVREKSNENKKPKYVRRKFLFFKVLAILIAVTVLIYFLVFVPRKLNSLEVLNKAISHYDYYGRWQDFGGKLHLITLFNNGDLSEEIIEIHTKDNFYKCTSFNSSSKDTIIKGIISGKCFRQVNHIVNPDQNLIEKYDLDSLNIDDIKHQHYWHFGGIVFLKNSGMRLKKEVVRTNFLGHKCIRLSFVSDSLKSSINYFKDSVWNVYIDSDNYSVLGYKIKGGFYPNEFIVSCQEELDYNSIKIPMFKFYYNTTNNILLVDLFHKED